MTLRLLLLGTPTVEYGGESVALPFERRNQLLVFLALKRAWVGRAELAAMLWPELENKLAYTNLRKTLHRLQSLRWGAIESDGGALRFDADTDVFELETALREQRLADALPLRRGELLAGFEDDASEAWTNWLHFERDRLRVVWRDAALTRLNAQIETGEAIELSARLLDLDPLDEAALRAHMTSLARGGQNARARQVYRDFVARVAQDLGLEPSVDLQALHDSLSTNVPSMPVTKPTAPTLDADFVGRTVELRRIATLLAQDDCRLLCITGPGGIGKTRVARRALQQMAPSFADGAVFVPLDDLASVSEFGGRLARELGLSLAGRDDPLNQVVEFLRDRNTLLVLDNFEHLAAAAPILQRLIEQSPRLKVIATSRVRLSLPMEWLMPLEGLPCPEIEDQDHFEAFDAVRLFVQAAHRVEPALVPSVEAASIIDICQQLEGLPLALQLAAAWTRVLSCNAIAAELRQGIELLRASDAAHPARHASMEIVFDQSWRLLTASERDALSRLSVFRGGFTTEAARAVTAASLPVLGALSDKSLLRKDRARIHMHPLVQQLAARRLAEHESRAVTERGHAHYFHRVLAQLRRAIETGNRESIQQVDIELENCRLAWNWSIAHEDVDTLIGSAPTLLQFFDHSGRFGEGLALFVAALETQALSDVKLRAVLLASVAQLEFRLDRYAKSMEHAERARAAAKLAKDPDTHALSLQALGSCALRLTKYADAQRYFKEGLQQANAAGDLRKASTMLHNSALVQRLMGHRDEALRLFLESLARHTAQGDFVGEALSLANLGLIYADKGLIDSAIVQLKAALAICERHGFTSTRVLVLANLTGLAIKANDLAAAEQYGRSALDIAEATDNRHVMSGVNLNFARLSLQRGDLQAARAHLQTALQIATGAGRPALLSQGICCFAELLAAQGDRDCALAALMFLSKHPQVSVPERDEALARITQLGLTAQSDLSWPDLELNELVQRILLEHDVAYAPLLAEVRGLRRPTVAVH